MVDRLPTEFSLADPDEADDPAEADEAAAHDDDAGPAPGGPAAAEAGSRWPDPRLLAACAVVAAASLAVMAAASWLSASAASRQACVAEVQHLVWSNEGPADRDVVGELLGRCGIEAPERAPAGDDGDEPGR